MAEALDSPAEGDRGGQFRPFDRQALQATLADALKDAEEADHPPLAADEQGVPQAAPAETAPPTTPGGAPKPNPFGRPNAAAGGAAPAPSARRGIPGVPAPTAAPSPTTAANPSVRTGPSILSGGISAGLSPMASSLGAPGGGLGGTSIAGLRPPNGGPLASPGLGGGLGLGGVHAEPEEAASTATIPMRRPGRPAAAPVPAPETRGQVAAAAAQPARPSAPLAGWLPSDDDILPRNQLKRSRRRSRK
jgi:hypothetical protein